MRQIVATDLGRRLFAYHDWDNGSMDRTDAGWVGQQVLAPLRLLSYEALVSRFLDTSESSTVPGRNGTMYNVKVEAFWDARPHGPLRVAAYVDDDGLRSYYPLVEDFIIDVDGTFIGD
jgi:hypothetical protein